MLATVQRTVATRFPRIRGKRVLVACSGGADSTALTLALREMGCKIVLAHVHHGIRGRSATADARFVEKLAAKLNVPFALGKFDVPGEAKNSGESLEMAARRVRRDFLVTEAKRRKIQWVATGHTADDQAETILMRVARGTGVGGLAGIPYSTAVRGVRFVRPLRDATRAQVAAFLAERRQRWREDESNTADFALRNRVRHEILPLLEKRLNPGVRAALLRLGEIAAAEDEAMSALVRAAQRGKTPPAKLPLAVRRRLALAALRKSGMPPGEIDFDAVEHFPQCGKKFSIVWKNREKIFHSVEKSQKSFPYRGKNGANFPQCGKKFSIVWKNPGTFSTAWKKVFHSVEKTGVALEIRVKKGFSRRTDEVCLSVAAVGNRDLVFRSWRAGDRMKPLGMTGSKKLSDIFTDLKVPRTVRDSWVVVECGGQVAALAGWRVARAFAVEGPKAASIRIRGINANYHT